MIIVNSRLRQPYEYRTFGLLRANGRGKSGRGFATVLDSTTAARGMLY